MQPVEQPLTEGTRSVKIAESQDQYDTLPALVYPDGVVLTEWTLSEEERQAIARGENIRLWTWTFHQPFQPVKLEVTSEHRA